MMKPNEIVQTLQAVGPILWKAIRSGQIFNPACELTEPDPDILCEYDVKIPIDGGFSLTANVFRSRKAAETNEKVPVVMCAHPYNNNLLPALGTTPLKGPPQQYRLIPQSGGKPVFSKLTSWESPDPNFWVPAGYALVNLNLPGYASSGGPPSVFSEHQAKSYYEAIEWVAKQPWCTGKVGLNGVSFLAITQYHVAACQAYGGPPPSLRCISPWEGITDLYHDLFARGGLTEVGFPTFWWNTEVKETINGPVETFLDTEGSIPPEYVENHPFFDAFWEEKSAKLDQIDVPMLVCASFSDHGLHTMGSFRAYLKGTSLHKWVYTHRAGKWVSYYSPEVQQLTKDFMDCFLKEDTSSGFLETPPLRLEVRSSKDVIHAVRHEDAWPIARTEYTKLFLDQTQSPMLSETQPEAIQSLAYSAKKGIAIFTFKFDADTELSGYMKLRVWVEARPENAGAGQPDDMAMFVAVNKLDGQSNTVHFYGSVGNDQDMVTRGCLRVSRRELDTAESTEWNPVLSGRSEQKLKAGDVVPVDIALYPSSTFFVAGESLQLILSSDEIIPSPPYKKSVDFNRGQHVLHFGGTYDSHLLVPIIPA
ncbi:MAG: CocE/NonD family hydrolase [Chloroflexota bacterium]